MKSANQTACCCCWRCDLFHGRALLLSLVCQLCCLSDLLKSPKLCFGGSLSWSTQWLLRSLLEPLCLLEPAPTCSCALAKQRAIFPSSLQWMEACWFILLEWFCTGSDELWSWQKGRSRNVQPEGGKSLCQPGVSLTEVAVKLRSVKSSAHVGLGLLRSCLLGWFFC